jgi:hypothetical protein
MLALAVISGKFKVSFHSDLRRNCVEKQFASGALRL